MGGEEVKELDRVREGFWRIAREILESAYSWDSEGDGKTEIAGIRNNVEYFKSDRRILHTYTQTHININTHIHTHTHTHKHTHTHTHLVVVVVWPPACQGTEALCKQCELLTRESRCNIRSDQGWPNYGWRCVELPNGGRFIGLAQMEGRNSYRGFGIGSTVSHPSVRQVRKLVDRCCSYTRHLT